MRLFQYPRRSPFRSDVQTSDIARRAIETFGLGMKELAPLTGERPNSAEQFSGAALNGVRTADGECDGGDDGDDGGDRGDGEGEKRHSVAEVDAGRNPTYAGRTIFRLSPI